MVDIRQGDVWWADLDEPAGTAAGFRRPVVVVQGDALNRSKLGTVVCIPLTSNLNWAEAPGNVRLSARASGLSKDSVAVLPHIIAIDRSALVQRVGRLPQRAMEMIFAGLDVVLGR